MQQSLDNALIILYFMLKRYYNPVNPLCAMAAQGMKTIVTKGAMSYPLKEIAKRRKFSTDDSDGLTDRLSKFVDEHAKLKTQLKTKQSSQPRASSPTCVSRVTWGPTQVSWIPDESHKRSHNDNRLKGSHVRGIPRPRDPTSIQNNRRGDQRSARI